MIDVALNERLKPFLREHLPVPLYNRLRVLAKPLRAKESDTFESKTQALLDDEPELGYLLSILPKSCVSMDVGANIGCFSHHLCQAFPGGNVIAFEARHDLYEDLCRNLRERTNFKAYNLAVSDTPGELRISLDPCHGNSSVEDLPTQRGLKRQKVRAIMLDEFVLSMGLTSLDFLKIDVEGHESKVLTGAAATIRRFRPIILCESENRHLRSQGESAEDVLSSFVDLFDYECFYYFDGQLKPFSREIVPQDRTNADSSYINNWILIPREKNIHEAPCMNTPEGTSRLK